MGKRIFVVTGGEQAALGPGASDSPYDFVIAADSGLDLAGSLGIRADVVVGDLDSVSPGALENARRSGVEIDAHPAEKDHTDLELALRRALVEAPSEITVIGGGGGRPDHWLTNLGLLAATARSGVRVSAEMSGWSVCVLVPGHPYSEVLAAGELVSLLPVGGDARGVTTEGLVFPLRHEDLPAGTSRGMSNRSLGGPVQVHIAAGTLLLMRPRLPLPVPHKEEVSR